MIGTSIRVQKRTHIDLSKLMNKPGKHVEVGFPEGEVPKEIIQRAFMNNFGTRNIPARPFLMNAVRDNRRKYTNAMKRFITRYLRGKEAFDSALKKLGIIAKNDIQEEITDLRSPANAPSTVKQKGSSNPLIDSGEMRAHVTYKVRDNERRRSNR